MLVSNNWFQFCFQSFSVVIADTMSKFVHRVDYLPASSYAHDPNSMQRCLDGCILPRDVMYMTTLHTDCICRAMPSGRPVLVFFTFLKRVLLDNLLLPSDYVNHNMLVEFQLLFSSARCEWQLYFQISQVSKMGRISWPCQIVNELDIVNPYHPGNPNTFYVEDLATQHLHCQWASFESNLLGYSLPDKTPGTRRPPSRASREGLSSAKWGRTPTELIQEPMLGLASPHLHGSLLPTTAPKFPTGLL